MSRQPGEMIVVDRLNLQAADKNGGVKEPGGGTRVDTDDGHVALVAHAGQVRLTGMRGEWH